MSKTTVTGDCELINEVMTRIGLSVDHPERNQDFVNEQITWLVNNASFIKEIDTKEKARAYVEKHLGD